MNIWPAYDAKQSVLRILAFVWTIWLLIVIPIYVANDHLSALLGRRVVARLFTVHILQQTRYIRKFMYVKPICDVENFVAAEVFKS